MSESGPRLEPAGSTLRAASTWRMVRGAVLSKRYRSRCCALIGLSLAGACAAPDADPRLRIRFAPTPPVVGVARVLVQAPPEVVLTEPVTISARGPETTVPAQQADRVSEGVFAVDSFPFESAGDWVVIAVGALSDGTPVADSAVVRVVAAPSG